MNGFLKKARQVVLGLGDFATFSFRSTALGITHPLRLSEVVENAYTLGIQSLPVILFTGFFAGLSNVLFLQGELEQYGAKITLGRVIGVTAVRELGPLVVALMLTGRVGAAIAAELGSMKIGNQVDAITALGQDPERKLATPRVWALTLISPVLTVFCVLANLVGGWVVATVDSGMYWYQAQMALYWRHVSSGLFKPFVFGWLIATVACYFGLRTENGVRGVGNAVSRAVVTCCILIFVSNALMGLIFIALYGL